MKDSVRVIWRKDFQKQKGSLSCCLLGVAWAALVFGLGVAWGLYLAL